MDALRIAASGMSVAAANTEVTANNIANSGTKGFNEFRLASSDLSYKNIRSSGLVESEGIEPRPVGIDIGSGSKVAGVYRIVKQGTITNSGNPLHMAISGPGYFRVRLPNGQFGYSRNGIFHKSPNGLMTNSEGYVLDPEINLTNYQPDTIEITKDGKVKHIDPQNRSENEIGAVSLYKFPNEQGLTPIGNNLLTPNEGSGEAIEIQLEGSLESQIVSKSYEESTVDIVSGLSELIVVQRSYELCAKVMKSADEMLQSANNIK